MVAYSGNSRDFAVFCSLQVVAPVRETCAQALGVVLHHMTLDRVHKVVQVLLQLLHQTQWEVRHGGMLGLKYVLAVREVGSALFVKGIIFKSTQNSPDDI